MSGETTNSNMFSKTFTVIVKPSSKTTLYNGIDENQKHHVALKEKAVDNKANIALIKFFKKEFGLSVKIKKGLTNREKVIELV